MKKIKIIISSLILVAFFSINFISAFNSQKVINTANAEEPELFPCYSSYIPTTKKWYDPHRHCVSCDPVRMKDPQLPGQCEGEPPPA